ncbi:hypothetical protein D3C86_1426210 [compost metagenome]
MRHHDGGEAKPLLQAADFNLHAFPKALVECAKRLVQQQHRRLDHQSARQCDTLLLAAGKLRRQPVAEGVQLNEIERLLHTPFPIGLGNAPHLETEGDVFGNGHMGKQGVVLKQHTDIAAMNRGARGRLAADHDFTRGGIDEPRNHAKAGRFPASARTEKRQDFPCLDGKRNIIDGNDLTAVMLGQSFQADFYGFHLRSLSR